MRVAFYALRSAAVLALGSAFVASAQPIATYAGGGRPDGKPATGLPYYGFAGVASDTAGDLYIAGRDAHVVWRVDGKTGLVTTAAGNGTYGTEGDGEQATKAALKDPVGVALDKQGNLYVADLASGRVRKVDAGTGVIRTFAGGGEPADELGDGGPATNAALDYPWGLTITPSGDLLIGTVYGNRVRKVTVATGVITTVAGGTSGFGGEGGAATSAALLG